MKLEAEFEVKGTEVGHNRGENCVMVKGWVLDPVDGHVDGVEVEGSLMLRLHTSDGQSPFKLGQKLRVIITDAVDPEATVVP